MTTKSRSPRGPARSRAKSRSSRTVRESASATERALRERVKELTCLYEIVKLRVRENLSLEALLQGVVELLPSAWQYPELALARVTVDGRCYQTRGSMEPVQRQSTDIVVGGTRRGTVEVGYAQHMKEREEGPFLSEERRLLDTVAREIGLALARRRAEEEAAEIQDQLRHADRLATIGQLSAGVAHELNEPLGSILGFAQLVVKTEGLPDQVSRDMEKIIRATLHAREIVKGLMLFARQMPPNKVHVDLNRLVHEGLELLESRWLRGGIKLTRDLAPSLPGLSGDPAQLLQVIVNLVLNAIQAMPDGGTIRLRTLLDGDKIVLVVEDDGLGMSEDVARQAFVPFFTTKDVGEGTGLGLSIVHGIVTSHGGSIRLESRGGGGTRLEVALPVRPQQVGRHD